MGLDMYLIKRKKEDRKKDVWDFPFNTELIYWRKANAIHRFLCDNGEEIEQEVSYKITKEVLEELFNKCMKVLEVAKTEKSMIENGKRYENGEWKPILEEGFVITNQEEVEEILPTCKGFFFGSTAYDKYYLNDIERTRDELSAILPTIDFENEDIYYLASW